MKRRAPLRSRRRCSLSGRHSPLHSSSPILVHRHLLSPNAPRARRSVLTFPPFRHRLKKPATARCRIFCAQAHQIFPAALPPPAVPNDAQHRPPPLRFAESPPRSLPLLRSETARFRLSILRACRHTAPLSNRSVLWVRRRPAPREQASRIFHQRIVGCLCAFSLPRTEFPSTKLMRSQRPFRLRVFPHRAFAAT